MHYTCKTVSIEQWHKSTTKTNDIDIIKATVTEILTDFQWISNIIMWCYCFFLRQSKALSSNKNITCAAHNTISKLTIHVHRRIFWGWLTDECCQGILWHDNECHNRATIIIKIKNILLQQLWSCFKEPVDCCTRRAHSTTL